jgi:hypothetical protein
VSKPKKLLMEANMLRIADFLNASLLPASRDSFRVIMTVFKFAVDNEDLFAQFLSSGHEGAKIRKASETSEVWIG